MYMHIIYQAKFSAVSKDVLRFIELMSKVLALNYDFEYFGLSVSFVMIKKEITEC